MDKRSSATEQTVFGNLIVKVYLIYAALKEIVCAMKEKKSENNNQKPA